MRTLLLLAVLASPTPTPTHRVHKQMVAPDLSHCAKPFKWHHDATLKANVCEPAATPTPVKSP